MNKKIKIILMLLSCLSLFLWWRVEFYGAKTGIEEVAIENGRDSFQTSIDNIYYVAVSNENVNIAGKLENESCILQLNFLNSNGDIVAECVSDSISIHTDGYTSIESSNFSNMPVKLNKDEKYSVVYSCKTQDGTDLKNLSFMLYGTNKSSNRYSALIFLIAAIAIGIGIWTAHGNGKESQSYAAVLILMTMLSLFIMPVLASESENSAFANVYGTSNVLLGKEACDENGYVYIEESGIRNGGYMSYSTPLLRFWTDWNYGNVKASNAPCANYSYDGAVNILMIPSITAVSISRLLGLPYQLIKMSGWVINTIISMILVFCSIMVLGKKKKSQKFIELVFLLPSVIIASMSYTAFGIFIALTCLVITLFICQNSQKNNGFRGYIGIVVSGAVILVTLLQKLYFSLKENTIGIGSINDIFVFLFSETDRMINEAVVYEYFGYENIFLATYIMIIILCVMKFQRDKELSKTESGKYCIDGRVLTIWVIVYVAIVLISSTIDRFDSQSAYSRIMGVWFIPMLIIPCKRKCGVMKNSEQRDDILRLFFLVCSVIVTIVRYGSM